MKGKYKLTGPVVSLSLKLEKTAAEMLVEMSRHTGIPDSEIKNMALKFFASIHRDFFPATAGKARREKAGAKKSEKDADVVPMVKRR